MATFLSFGVFFFFFWKKGGEEVERGERRTNRGRQGIISSFVLLLLSLFQLTAPVPAERRRSSGVVCGVEGEKPSA
jgi:hypothetical protein